MQFLSKLEQHCYDVTNKYFLYTIFNVSETTKNNFCWNYCWLFITCVMKMSWCMAENHTTFMLLSTFFFATLLLHNNIIYSFLSINILNSFSEEKRTFLQATFDNDWTTLKNGPHSLFSPWGTCPNHSLQTVYFVLFLYPQLLLFTYWVNLENDKLILMST